MMPVEKRTKQKACPKCGYDAHEKGASTCSICNTSLFKDQTTILKNTHRKSSKPRKVTRESVSSSIAKNADKVRNQLLTKVNTKKVRSNLKEAQKPLNLLGLFLIALGVMLWFNYYFLLKTNQNIAQVSNEALDEPENEPVKGLFSYGGAPIFASIVASGVHGSIENQHPGYKLRYTKPLDEDYSSFNGIRMLLDSQLSFAYNERSLSEEEFQQASLRNLNLKQIPIAIDGVAVYGNKGIGVKQINREQLGKIFSGEFDSWRDIDPNAEDLPIIPVVLQNEELQMLGISNPQSLPESTEYVANHTQALRKIISTPGGISLASASLVGNQQLIDTFELSESLSSPHINPVIDGELNMEDFKNGRYPLTRRIFFVYRQDETIDESAAKVYIDYLQSAAGQQKISQAGLVPITNYSLEDEKN